MKRENVNLVLDLCLTDLEILTRDQTLVLRESDCKSFMLMAFKGLEYLHDNWVLHRDLKPSNLLVNSKGVVKISDLGLAACYGTPSRDLTSNVVTIWYRCPELLFGANAYGVGVDTWSMGCIMAEMQLRSYALFPGGSEVDQISKIFDVLDVGDWEEASALRSFVRVEPRKYNLRDILSAVSDTEFDLIKGLLIPNPSKRLSCKQALAHAHFFESPHPTPAHLLPLPKSNTVVLQELNKGAEGVSKKRITEEIEDDLKPIKKKLF